MTLDWTTRNNLRRANRQNNDVRGGGVVLEERCGPLRNVRWQRPIRRIEQFEAGYPYISQPLLEMFLSSIFARTFPVAAPSPISFISSSEGSQRPCRSEGCSERVAAPGEHATSSNSPGTTKPVHLTSFR